MAATTPRMMAPPSYPAPPMTNEHSEPRTPTRDSFGGLSGQRPLPIAAPLADVARAASSYIGRSDSGNSSRTIGSRDVDMEDAEHDVVSDNEDTEGEADMNSASKKKKSQRFFCTDFPPCQLSFTRSEHLARHIRKHTGERPFQCHCGKRFTRLDNLRQHAQTVHVNEDIPPESLAATGTRFQRQIRTDRVRPTTGRSRGSMSGHARGHSRNWSESSIGSVSDIASPIDRRPPSLVMTQMSPSRAGLTLDTSLAGGPEGYRPYYNESPNGYGTPSSAFSYGPSSPSTLASPNMIIPRGSPMPNRGEAASRRLTFPASQAPAMVMGPPSYPPGPQFYNPIPSSAASVYSQNGSGYASPINSGFPDGGRYPYEGDPRRRTWHPGNQYGSRPATSGLSYYQTPDDHVPMTANQPAATQAIRLPGIDSFLRQPSTGDVNPNRHSAYESSSRPIETGRGGHRDSWGSISSGFTHLEINRGQDASPQAVPSRPVTSSGLPPPGTFQMLAPSAPVHNTAMPPSSYHANARSNVVDAARGQTIEHPRPLSIDDSLTSRNAKRLGWYHGPPPVSAVESIVPAASRSPGGSNSSAEGLVTPAAAYPGEYAPGIIGNGGYLDHPRPDMPVDDVHKTHAAAPNVYALPPIDPPLVRSTPQTAQPPPAQNTQPNDMHRLDALVAAATSDAGHR